MSVSAELFVTAVLIVLGMLGFGLGRALQDYPRGRWATIQTKYHQGDERIWRESNQHLGRSFVRLSLAMTALSVLVVPLPDHIGLPMYASALFIGLATLVVEDYLHTIELWEHYHGDESPGAGL